ncbi:hypothetical protein KIPB_014396, partial [Kipferlia bialata]
VCSKKPNDRQKRVANILEFVLQGIVRILAQDKDLCAYENIMHTGGKVHLFTQEERSRGGMATAELPRAPRPPRGPRVGSAPSGDRTFPSGWVETDGQMAKWENHLREVLEFRRVKGHWPTQRYVCGSWLANQRHYYRSGSSINPRRLRRLRESGVPYE